MWHKLLIVVHFFVLVQNGKNMMKGWNRKTSCKQLKVTFLLVCIRCKAFNHSYRRKVTKANIFERMNRERDETCEQKHQSWCQYHDCYNTYDLSSEKCLHYDQFMVYFVIKIKVFVFLLQISPFISKRFFSFIDICITLFLYKRMAIIGSDLTTMW